MALLRVRAAAEQAIATWKPTDLDEKFIYDELDDALQETHDIEINIHEREVKRQQHISGG